MDSKTHNNRYFKIRDSLGKKLSKFETKLQTCDFTSYHLK